MSCRAKVHHTHLQTMLDLSKEVLQCISWWAWTKEPDAAYLGCTEMEVIDAVQVHILHMPAEERLHVGSRRSAGSSMAGNTGISQLSLQSAASRHLLIRRTGVLS